MKLNPRISYCGLTIVMSNPSRFDTVELLSATGGYLFKSECLGPELNLMSCEVRLKEDRSTLRPGTLVVLLLGKDAFELWTGNKDNSLGEVRGSVYMIDGIAHLASYLPQDCADVKDYEGEFNEILQASYAEDEGKGDKSALSEKRRHGKTSRTNWRFWLKQDTKKAIQLLKNGGKIPARKLEPQYVIYPNSDEVIERLNKTRNEEIFLDIETDSNLSITCCGLGFADGLVYVVPFVDYLYRKPYHNLSKLVVALSRAIYCNTVVSHNGAAFDWFVLAFKYHIPISWKVYDTMLAQHRIFPEVEKSLGHCTSLWTFEPFHKDESYFNFSTSDQFNKLMQYCGKDVFTMMLIKKAQDEYVSTRPGLKASIEQVNKSVRPYLTMTLQGIHFKEDLRASIVAENDRLMMQYLRMIKILIGGETSRTLDRASKKGMPGSNKKCTEYFHTMLDYPVIARSPKTGKPSLGAKAMFKLRLKHNNPVIDLILAYRGVQKETGSLQFTPWKA